LNIVISEQPTDQHLSEENMVDTPSDQPAIGRRKFLKGVTIGGAAALVGTEAPALPVPPKAVAATLPGSKMIAAETMPPEADPVHQSSSGGDFMVDVLKTLDIDYLAITCGSTFRGLHEAVVNYGNNRNPEVITCNHEEIGVAMAHGYAKMEGKPMATACHGTVGLQHATMAIYNAWCDRAPVYVMIGNILEADKRSSGGAEWPHSAIDPALIVRDFTKWDDQPITLQHFAESAVRAYKIATTPPMGPVLLSLDGELQENPIPNRQALNIPKFAKVAPPVGDSGALAEAAKMLVVAENPVIICDRMSRTQAGIDALVTLAETLQCAVIDGAGRLNFPSRHPLNQTASSGAVVSRADVVLAIEMNDVWGSLNNFSDRIVRSSRSLLKPGAQTITLGNRDLYIKANYQDFGRFQAVDLPIAGDGEASLPILTEAVKRLIDEARISAFEARGKKLADAKAAVVDQAKADATIGWDASPITTARLCAELYAQIKDDDWSLVGTGIGLRWPALLWNMDKSHRWNGRSGGAGVGYNAPASLGAALANKGHGRLSIAIQGDGDLLFVPSTLWTAAHHRIPILYVMHNNRAYHQEFMHLVVMAARLGRRVQNAHIGATITDPNVDFATLARAFGVYGAGPITDPKDLAPALSRALTVVRGGEPALIDVVTEPR
jgi:acetolactate synthase I/II/III large subunit